MSETLKNIPKPIINISEEPLREAGFIDSGIAEFKQLTSAFCNKLFETSRSIAKNGDECDIIRNHVQSAGYALYSHKSVSKWSIVPQIVDRLSAIGVGVGASNLKDNWGQITFAVCFALWSIAIVVGVIMKKN